jgi:hypothetical protein
MAFARLRSQLIQCFSREPLAHGPTTGRVVARQYPRGTVAKYVRHALAVVNERGIRRRRRWIVRAVRIVRPIGWETAGELGHRRVAAVVSGGTQFRQCVGSHTK